MSEVQFNYMLPITEPSLSLLKCHADASMMPSPEQQNTPMILQSSTALYYTWASWKQKLQIFITKGQNGHRCEAQIRNQGFFAAFSLCGAHCNNSQLKQCGWRCIFTPISRAHLEVYISGGPKQTARGLEPFLLVLDAVFLERGWVRTFSWSSSSYPLSLHSSLLLSCRLLCDACYQLDSYHQNNSSI